MARPMAVLHGAAEADALLKLLGDVLGHQLSVHVGVLDFDDGELHRLADHLFDSPGEALDLRSPPLPMTTPGLEQWINA
jgi:hypothetical protein